MMPEIPGRRVVCLLGQGGMGSVYKAYHLEENRPEAIKVLSPRFAASLQVRARFRREGKVLTRLRHPGLTCVYETGDARDTSYIAMELIEGTSLAALVKERALEPARALAIVTAAAEALAYVHDQGFTHRDVKPANILVSREGPAKVVDFGLVTWLNEELTHQSLTVTGQMFGTPFYMAPEQTADAKTADNRVDIYALGVTLYQCLTGQLPIGEISMPCEMGLAVDPRLDRIIRKMIQTDPELRYQSMHHVVEDLQVIRQAAEARTGSVPAPEFPREPVRATAPACASTAQRPASPPAAVGPGSAPAGRKRLAALGLAALLAAALTGSLSTPAPPAAPTGRLTGRPLQIPGLVAAWADGAALAAVARAEDPASSLLLSVRFPDGKPVVVPFHLEEDLTSLSGLPGTATVWAGTRSGALLTVDLEARRVLYRERLPGRPLALAPTRSGDLLIALERGGLVVLDSLSREIRQIKLLQVEDVCTDRKRGSCYAVSGGTVVRFDERSGIAARSSGLPPLAALAAADGAVFAASRDRSRLVALDGETLSVRGQMAVADLASGPIAAAGAGRLLVPTRDGTVSLRALDRSEPLASWEAGEGAYPLVGGGGAYAVCPRQHTIIRLALPE